MVDAIKVETNTKISASDAKDAYIDHGLYNDEMYICADDKCKQPLILGAKENDAQVSAYFRAKSHHSIECGFYNELEHKLSNPKSGLNIVFRASLKEEIDKEPIKKNSNGNGNGNGNDRIQMAINTSLSSLLKKHNHEYRSLVNFLSESDYTFEDKTLMEGKQPIQEYFIHIESIEALKKHLSKFKILYGIVKFWWEEKSKFGKEYVKLSFQHPFNSKSEHVTIYLNEQTFKDEFNYLKNLYIKQTKINPSVTPSIGMFVRTIINEDNLKENSLILKYNTNIWLLSLRGNYKKTG